MVPTKTANPDSRKPTPIPLDVGFLEQSEEMGVTPLKLREWLEERGLSHVAAYARNDVAHA